MIDREFTRAEGMNLFDLYTSDDGTDVVQVTDTLDLSENQSDWV